MGRCNRERKGRRRRCILPPVHPSPATSTRLHYTELGPDFAAGGGDKTGNAKQKSRGGRGRGMGRQRLLSTPRIGAGRSWVGSREQHSRLQEAGKQ